MKKVTNIACLFALLNFLFILSCSILNKGNGTNKRFKSFFGTQTTTWNVAFEGIDAYLTENITVGSTNVLNNFRIVSINERFALKENLYASKLWLVDKEEKKEILLVDLDLKEGDKFQMPNGEIAIVDSVYEINRNKIIRLNYKYFFDGKRYDLIFMEGVGSNAAFFCNMRHITKNEQLLLCVNKDGELFNFNYSTIDNCQYFSTNARALPAKIEFNQITEKVHCFFNEIFYGSVDIEDGKGNKVNQIDIKGLPYLEIDTKGLSNGNYTITIKNSEEIITKALISKSN